MELYNALGQRDKMTAQYRILDVAPSGRPTSKRPPTTRSRTTTTSSGIRPAGTGARTGRPAPPAEASLTQFYAKEHSRGPSAKYALEAAYRSPR